MATSPDIRDLVQAAHVHSINMFGEPLIEGLPDDDPDMDIWCNTHSDAEAMKVVIGYLRGSY